MKMRFWSLLWLSFLEINGWVFGLLSLIVTFGLYILSPQTQIPVYAVIALVCLVVLAIVTLIHALNKALRKLEEESKRLRKLEAESAQGLIPKVRTVIQLPSQENIYLLEPSEFFAHNAMVSFYYVYPEGLEAMIATGFVRTVQTNGLIQIQMQSRIDTYKAILDRLDNNDNEILQKIVVKPIISRNLLPPSTP